MCVIDGYFQIEQLKKDRQLALASQDRLSRMKTEKDEFLNLLRGQRKEIFKVGLNMDFRHRNLTYMLIKIKARDPTV